MSYYSETEQWTAKGVDSDLYYCLDYNPQEGFGLADIERVAAVVEGEHDEAAWHWLLALTEGRFVYLTGGCDYTGWD